ncbi:hypothetical protein D3C78_19240 [compost metagenome]
MSEQESLFEVDENKVLGEISIDEEKFKDLLNKDLIDETSIAGVIARLDDELLVQSCLNHYLDKLGLVDIKMRRTKSKEIKVQVATLRIQSHGGKRIYEKSDCIYYDQLDKAGPIMLTNFIITNVRKTVTSRKEHIMIVDAVCDGVTSKDIILNGTVLSKPADFRSHMRTRCGGKLNQTITPSQYDGLIDYIDSLPFRPVVSIPYLGYHYENEIPFMAYLDKVKEGYSEQQVVKVVTADGVELNHEIFFPDLQTTESKFYYPECEENEWKNLTKTILENFPYANDFNKTMLMLAWFLATPLRHLPDHDRRLKFRFPLMHIAGTPGSGKTTLVKKLAEMMGYTTGGGSFTKIFVNMKNMAESNAHFVWVDEYKVDKKYSRDAASALADLLRRNYDSGLEERGNADKSKTIYHLISPFIMSGESEITDTATLERTIQIIMSKEETESKYKGNKYYAVVEDLSDIDKFALRYHQWLLSNHKNWTNWIDEAKKIISDFANMGLPDRVLKKGMGVTIGMIIMRELAKEVDANMESFSVDKMKIVLENLYKDNQERQREESLEAFFINFLAENWTSGLNARGDVPVHTKHLGDTVALARGIWVKRFRDHCAMSDRGPQQENIIDRTLKELASKGCIELGIGGISMGRNNKPRCFAINIQKTINTYGLEEDIWDLDPEDPLILE